MTKMYKYGALCTLMVLVLASCYKDRGNYNYKQQQQFRVDTVGMRTSFEVQKAVTPLSIEPKIVYEEDASRLTYLWRIYLTSTANTIADTLSRQKNFSGTIDKTPGTYYLELQVTDTVNGVKALMQYSVVVRSPYPYGWMVIYEKDGGSEIGMVRTSDIIAGLPKDTVLLDAFQTINKRKLTGLPLKIQQSGRMWFAGEGFGAYVVYAVTTAGGAMMDYVSLDYLTDYRGMFLTKPSVIKPDGFEGELGLLANEKSIYSTFLLSPFFTGPAVEPNKGYEVNDASFTNTDFNIYDQKNRRFLIMSTSGPFVSEFLPANSGAALFDLSNIGKELLFQQNGFSNYRYAYFRNPSGTGLYLYTINFAGQQASPRDASVALVDLSTSPGAADARFFAVSSRGPVAFYANEKAIYRTSTLTNSATLAFDGFGNNERITAMKLFKAVGSGYTSATTRNSQLMFVATWNPDTREGFVYVITVNEVSGQMNTSAYKKFGGFGKIADMGLKAN